MHEQNMLESQDFVHLILGSVDQGVGAVFPTALRISSCNSFSPVFPNKNLNIIEMFQVIISKQALF